jgi:hypothetical protein
VTPDPLLSSCLTLLERLGRARGRGALRGRAQARELAAGVWPDPAERELAAQALCQPHLALTMLWRTLGQGLRGNPHHLRPRDGEVLRLARDLLALLRAHLRLCSDLAGRVDWPAGGVPAGSLSGDGGWCDLCGLCCCHCGTVPAAPTGVDYPAYWYHLLAGEAAPPQPFCPFLFQTLDRPLYFCGLHPIKPLPCRQFDRADCQRGLPFRGLAR